jgi:hypothetical protein
VRGDRVVALGAEIPLRIQEVLSSIRLEARPVQGPLKRGTRLDIPLRVTAHLEDGRGVGNLPMRFAFTRGSGELIHRAWTGDEGVAESRLWLIGAPDRAQTIKAQLDLAALLAAESLDSSLVRQLEPFAVPWTAFELEVVPRTVYVASRKSAGERDFGPMVREALAKLGLGLAEGAGQADLVVEVSGQVRQGGRASEIHFAFVDVELAAGEPGAGVLQTSLRSVKGAGLNGEQAERRACEKAGEELRQRVLPEVLEALERR